MLINDYHKIIAAMNGVVIAVGLGKLTQVLMRKNQLRLKMSTRSNVIRTVDKKLIIEFQEGWEFIMQRGINKLVIYLEEGNARRYPDDPPFSSEECMMLYTTIFNMCTQKPPHEHTHQLYDYYVMAFEEYINANVLPSLREAHDEFLLRELVQRWMNHKIMVKWLSKFFCYLDQYFLAARCLPPVKDAGLRCFRKLLYEEINGRAKDAVISLITREREGEQIDQTLVKNVLHIFVEIGIENMECYLNEFGIPCRVSSPTRLKNAYRERRIGFFTLGARGQAIDLEQVKQVEIKSNVIYGKEVWILEKEMKRAVVNLLNAIIAALFVDAHGS